jgi:hypothetical protein
MQKKDFCGGKIACRKFLQLIFSFTFLHASERQSRKCKEFFMFYQHSVVEASAVGLQKKAFDCTIWLWIPPQRQKHV